MSVVMVVLPISPLRVVTFADQLRALMPGLPVFGNPPRMATPFFITKASVRAVLEHVVGADQAARFALVLAGDVVPRKKPAPDIYELAVERLGVAREQALVIEDSRNGLLAAAGAGLDSPANVSPARVLRTASAASPADAARASC